MSFKFKDAGSVLRTITAARFLQSGSTLRRFLRMKVMDTDGTTLRLVATFADPLTVTVTSFSRGDSESGIFYFVQATPAGGLGPYTYAGTVTSGTGTIANNTSATSQVSGSGPVTFHWVVTDSAGQTANGDTTLTFS